MTPLGYEVLAGSECDHSPDSRDLKPTAPGELITLTLILRRGSAGADPRDLRAAEAFARTHGLHVLDSDAAGSAVVARGTASAIERAFGLRLHDYEASSGKYRGYAGAASVPRGLAGIVEAVAGLDSRKPRMERHAPELATRPG